MIPVRSDAAASASLGDRPAASPTCIAPSSSHAMSSATTTGAAITQRVPAWSHTRVMPIASSPHRTDEPYRRALIGVYARLVASADERLGEGVVPARTHRGDARPYASAAEFGADLGVLVESLAQHHGASLTSQRLSPLARAAEVFGFHLASIDLRQSSDIHEAVVAELAEHSGVEQALRPQQQANLCRPDECQGFDVDTIEVEGHKLVAAHVERSASPVAAQGAFFWRTGDRLRPLSAAEIRRRVTAGRTLEGALAELSNIAATQTRTIESLTAKFDRANSWTRKLGLAGVGAVAGAAAMHLFNVLVA